MSHKLFRSKVENLEYCPFEDILGIGHSSGFSSISIPGAGEPNFDTFEANPYENKKQKQEAEVKKLLEKLQPNMITIDPEFIGRVDESGDLLKEKQEAHQSSKEEKEKKTWDKNKKKSFEDIRSFREEKKWDKKKAMIIETEEKIKKEETGEVDQLNQNTGEHQARESDPALSRFKKRRRA
jgi:U3 small nucleolar RNA-associated protein 7